jgi:hypothetical protein
MGGGPLTSHPSILACRCWPSIYRLNNIKKYIMLDLMRLLDRAVKYNTVMRRDKKWIQKCRALVVFLVWAIAARSEQPYAPAGFRSQFGDVVATPKNGLTVV